MTSTTDPVIPIHDRRQFLKLSAGLALTSIPWISGCGTQPPSPVSSVDPKAWGELAAHLSGELMRPGHAGFKSLSGVRNLRYEAVKLPAGIARCQSAEDVRVCLQWAQSHKLPVVARGGGHSYAAYSSTPGLMIELKKLDSVAFDTTSGRAKVGGGARNLTLYDRLPSRHASITHGVCASVGVGGLVLGGGIGFNVRQHGLLIDQLLETEIVTAGGKLLRCNEKENADLFWACRGGGGGNFGINTSFTFQTFPVDQVTVFNFVWTSKLDELLSAALDLLPAMPERLGCTLVVETEVVGELSMDLTGQYKGDPGDLRKLLAPLFRVAMPMKEEVRTMGYWEAQKTFLGEDGDAEYFDERSRYAFNPMSKAACRTVLEHLRRWPGTHVGASWKMFLLGGAVSRVAANATAYSHRAASMLTAVEVIWKADDRGAKMAANQAWIAGFHEAMAEHTSQECYQNFIDDSQANYLRAYYGLNLERLVAGKRAVDPGNVFNYRQSIPVSL